MAGQMKLLPLPSPHNAATTSITPPARQLAHLHRGWDDSIWVEVVGLCIGQSDGGIETCPTASRTYGFHSDFVGHACSVTIIGLGFRRSRLQ